MTDTADADPHVARISVHPVKALDAITRESADIGSGGNLALDRRYAILDRPADASYDPDTADPGGTGDYVNAKRTADIHPLRSSFDPTERTLTIRVDGGGEGHTFDLESSADRAELDEWLSDYFDMPVSLREESVGGHPDYRAGGLSGPSVVSTATLREVASWFDGLDIDNVRRRFRANIEIGGVPPFWEDRLYGDRDEAVAFRVGDARFEGIEPCERCVVPTRDPDTGAATEGFRETFVRRREETRPEWLDSERFDHAFRLMVITHAPESEWGTEIEVGDPVEVIGAHTL